MNRRSAVALLVVVLVVAGGRWIRSALMVGAAGTWRESTWLAEQLPRIDAAVEPRPQEPFRGPLNVNTCRPDSLELLPGIGPKLAARIAAARRTGPRFLRVDDLRRVKGIGPAVAAKLAPYLTFPGTTDTLPEAAQPR